MKKGTLIIFLGILFFCSGIYLYSNKKEPVQNIQNVNLNREQAVSVMKSLILDTISIYENPSNYFNVEIIEGDNLVKVLDYDDKVDRVFTKDGKKELENMMFDNKKFVTKNDDGVFVLNSIPLDNKIINSTISFNKVVIKSNEISSEVTFSNDTLNNDGNVLYKIITKDIVISKIDDSWYINSFVYSNK